MWKRASPALCSFVNAILYDEFHIGLTRLVNVSCCITMLSIRIGYGPWSKDNIPLIHLLFAELMYRLSFRPSSNAV